MATYKVIQDIEAEDKLVGPLSFRQFVYALITAFCIYLSVVCIVHHVGFLAILFLPPGLFTGFLAFPFGKDQPTEVWALAKLRFLLKPHKRIWDQSGVKELVTITVPKKLEVVRTNGLDQTEVKSRLHALADTIDSRGWAIKNVNVNLYGQSNGVVSEDSDRLIDVATLPQEVPNYDVQASDDILDEQNNPIAQQMDHMINASTSAHRQQLMRTLDNQRLGSAPAPSSLTTPQSTPPNDYWFMQNSGAQPVPNANSQTATNSPAATTNFSQPTTADEQALLKQIRSQSDSQHTSYAHLRTIQPMSSSPKAVANGPLNTAAPTHLTPVTQPPDPAILALANNNDLNVATLARQAKRTQTSGEEPQDEVVISLH